jgi:hypothetical protein
MSNIPRVPQSRGVSGAAPSGGVCSGKLERPPTRPPRWRRPGGIQGAGETDGDTAMTRRKGEVTPAHPKAGQHWPMAKSERLKPRISRRSTLRVVSTAVRSISSFIRYDDGHSPARAVEQARKLVGRDGVLLIFNPLGTPSNTASPNPRRSKFQEGEGYDGISGQHPNGP